MPVQFALAHLTVLGSDPLDQIEMAADAGYDYVGIRTTAVAADERVTSLIADRLFSIRTGLEASTGTPGSTAPDGSRTTPAIEA